ncbi:putative Rol_Rep_N domain-containing protein [Ruminococcaceae bacterium BL-6]|nr:putative Rol_Rep_N domain-containing protein [Ruminococcaceae bacterium BL-6]CAB1248021.1 putative Rol_Rep_N domain-containing protein [Ruminococcaceae bacterium BL-6]
MEVKQNLLVDYLVMSFKVQPDQAGCFLEFIVRLLNFPLEEAESIKSYYGFPSCYYYAGIKIHYTDTLIVLDMSGKGCRTCEQLHDVWNWYSFLCLFDRGLTVPIKDSDYSTEGRYSVHISRIDVASDLLGDDRITLPFLQRYVLKDKFICKSNYHTCVIGNKETAIYFGSPRSDRRLRIYDKALEQGVCDAKWVRFEFQLRNDNALSFYLNLSRTCNGNFMECYYGMLHDYLRFTTRPNPKGVKHTDRLVVCAWWKKFLQGVRKIPQLYLPGNDYDISSISRVYARQCASTVHTLIEAAEGDITQIIDVASFTPLNRRQREALSRWESSRNAVQDASDNVISILEHIGDA